MKKRFLEDVNILEGPERVAQTPLLGSAAFSLKDTADCLYREVRSRPGRLVPSHRLFFLTVKLLPKRRALAAEISADGYRVFLAGVVIDRVRLGADEATRI
jgi:hypothetical protein